MGGGEQAFMERTWMGPWEQERVGVRELVVSLAEAPRLVHGHDGGIRYEYGRTRGDCAAVWVKPVLGGDVVNLSTPSTTIPIFDSPSFPLSMFDTTRRTYSTHYLSSHVSPSSIFDTRASSIRYQSPSFISLADSRTAAGHHGRSL